MKFDFDEDINVDLTPLIDVIFMLLVFFIMTTTFSKPVLDIILPSSEMAETAEKGTKEILITVDKEGNIYHGDKKISTDDVISLLKQYPNNVLNLFIDKNAPFESFVYLVDIAKKERGGNFIISTDIVEK